MNGKLSNGTTRRWAQIKGVWVLLGAVFTMLLVNRVSGLDRRILIGIQENELVDKAGHFLFFGVLSFLLHAVALKKLSFSIRRVFLGGGSAMILLGLLDEVSQLWFVGRDFDYFDLLANVLGAGIMGLLACLMFGFGIKSSGYRGEMLAPAMPFDPRASHCEQFSSEREIGNSPPVSRGVGPKHKRRRSREEKANQFYS